MLNWSSIKPLLRPNFGHVTVVLAVLLAVVGLEAIDTAPSASWLGRVALRQGVFLGVGLLAMMVVALPHHRLLNQLAYPMGVVAVLLLLVLLVPGMPDSLVPTKNGARRWIDLKITPFQPSELAKIAFVLVLARYLSQRQSQRTFLGLAPPFALALVPMGLILVEPDLGTALIFMPVLFAMLLAAGAKIRYLVAIVLIASSLAPVAYPMLRPHQKQRIMDVIDRFTGDTRHRDSYGFQGYKAMTTTGAGGATGYGKVQARKILRYNALPESHNDMIFAVICARWGLVGGLGVLGLYLLLIASAVLAAAQKCDPFARLMVVGFAAVIFTQVFVNVGMTVGLLPITGMTLPLISYGGTSLVANFAMVGMILGVASRPRKTRPRDDLEFGHAGALPA